MRFLVAAPVVFAGVTLAVAAATGALSGEWGDLSGYLLRTALVLWLLIGMVIPLEYVGGINRVFFLGWFSLVGGAIALTTIGLVLEERYLRGTSQTEWIREAGMPIALGLTVGAIVLVLRGMWLGRLDCRQNNSDLASQRYLVGGTLIGATALVLIELAVAYDLGEILS